MKTYGDSEFAKLERVWNETGIRPKGYDKAKADWDADFTISQQITQNTEEYIDPIRQAHIDYENEKYERLYNSDAWVDAQRNA